jgi:hypothetical protein
MDKLNPVTRRMLNIFDTAFSRHGYKGEVRLMSHTLFATMSGILIAYRKYPGRSDQEILKHMKRIGKNVKEMIQVLIRQTAKNPTINTHGS